MPAVSRDWYKNSRKSCRGEGTACTGLDILSDWDQGTKGPKNIMVVQLSLQEAAMLQNNHEVFWGRKVNEEKARPSSGEDDRCIDLI